MNAWAVVIVALPIAGILAYLLLGEVRISLRRRVRGREIEAKLPRPSGDEALAKRIGAGFYRAPFVLGRSINDLPPTNGNKVTLAADSNAAIDAVVADIDGAKSTAHLRAYIWLADTNGLKIKDALVRAAVRGVTVRAMADALGSRLFIRSRHWRELSDSGVHVLVALPVGNPLWTFIRGRVDLRNHRKVLILDKRNDSIGVAGTSRSYYQDLVGAGVNLFEYRRGLLHAKTIVVDRKIGMIGSANLDRRSFELNFENNILFADDGFAAVLRSRQDQYLADCDPVTQADVDGFSIAYRLWQNSLAMMSPIL